MSQDEMGLVGDAFQARAASLRPQPASRFSQSGIVYRRRTAVTVDPQPWNPPYEIVDVPSDKVKLAFPENYFSATIIGDHIQLSISTDAAGLDAVKRRLQVLIEFAKLGPMPQRVPFWPREMEIDDIAQGIEAATAGETTKIGSTEGESPVRDSECAQNTPTNRSKP